MSKEPNRNVYVGHRYVPKIMGEWDNQIDYEGLSIVTHQGTSYTSKKRVPVGIDIFNEEFWVVTGNYNAQVEEYRNETQRVSNLLDEKADSTFVNTELNKKADKDFVDTELNEKADKDFVDTELNNKVDKNQRIINVKDFGAKGDGVTDDTVAFQNALNSFSDLGGELYVPSSDTYIVSSSLIMPVQSGTPTTLKNITVRGDNENNINAPKAGASNIKFMSAEGALFDLKNGVNDNITGSVTFKNIALEGSNTAVINNDITGILAHRLIGAKFENVSIRRFRNNMIITGMYYYTIFEQLKLYYASEYNLQTTGANNGSKFTRCVFTAAGKDSVIINDPSVLTVFDNCYFENNTEGYSIRCNRSIQTILKECYFERNKNIILFSKAPTYPKGILTLENCFMNHPTVSDDRMMNILSDCKVSLRDNTILWLSNTTLPMIYTTSENVKVVDINTTFIDRTPDTLYSQFVKVIHKIDDNGLVVDDEV